MAFGAWGWALSPVNDENDPERGQYFGGTSMSCPVVAGDLALAESAWKMKHPGRRLPARTGRTCWPARPPTSATPLSTRAVASSTPPPRCVRSSTRATLSWPRSGPTQEPLELVGQGRRRRQGDTTIVVTNTGAKTERVTLEPTTFATFKTITHAPITLTGPDYIGAESFTVPAGTDFVRPGSRGRPGPPSRWRARCTTPRATSCRTARPTAATVTCRSTRSRCAGRPASGPS